MKEIEIPFGAKDSELKGWEYTIPENMEAEIKDGKIIVREKESKDEKIRKQIIGFFSGHYALCKINTKDAIAYLERQKEQKSAEWSEEDELKRNNLIGLVEEIKRQPLKKLEDWDGYINFLKSLPERFNLQPNWKPSDEQMKALQSAIVFVEIRKASDYDISPLKELYEQLKKL